MMLSSVEHDVLRIVHRDRPVSSDLSVRQRVLARTLRRLGLVEAMPIDPPRRGRPMRLLPTDAGAEALRQRCIERLSRVAQSVVVALSRGWSATATATAAEVGEDVEAVRKALVRLEGRLTVRDTDGAYHNGHLWRLTEQGRRAAQGVLARRMAEARADREALAVLCAE